MNAAKWFLTKPFTKLLSLNLLKGDIYISQQLRSIMDSKMWHQCNPDEEKSCLEWK